MPTIHPRWTSEQSNQAASPTRFDVPCWTGEATVYTLTMPGEGPVGAIIAQGPHRLSFDPLGLEVSSDGAILRDLARDLLREHALAHDTAATALASILSVVPHEAPRTVSLPDLYAAT